MKFRIRDLARNIWLEETETSLHAFTDYYLTLKGEVIAFEGSIEKPTDVTIAALDHTDFSKRPLAITKGKDRFVVQQSTELSDPTGKELYVGDIVFVDEMLWVVKFWKGSFMILPVEEPEGNHGVLYEYTDCICVGNIYDNPNLLNAQKNTTSNPT